MKHTILIADDHPLFRQALGVAVARVAPTARIVEAGTLDSAVAKVRECGQTLALLLLDLKMPGAIGYSSVALLHAEAPQVPILVVSSADELGALPEVTRFGAVGFIGKNEALEVIEAAVANALAGRSTLEPRVSEFDAMASRLATLTPTQLRVLIGVLRGRLNKQIAFELGISEATVKTHMTAVLKKLDVRNRTQAALAAHALGLETTF